MSPVRRRKQLKRTMQRRPITLNALVSVAPTTPGDKRYSSGGVGLVKKKKRRVVTPSGDETVCTATSTQQSGESLFDVQYIIDNRLSQEIPRERVTIASLATTARRRSPNEEPRPSILSTSHRPTTTTASVVAPKQPPNHKKYSYGWLMANQSKKYKDKPLIEYALRLKKAKAAAGWLRRLDAPTNKALPKQLSTEEKKRAMDLFTALLPCDEAASLVGHAFDYTQQAILRMRKKMLADVGALDRKQRSDAGKTLITSQAKRESVITGKSVFEKDLRREQGDSKLTSNDISEAWSRADKSTVEGCNARAEELREQGPFFKEELIQALLRSSGTVSWRRLATMLAGDGTKPVSEKSIRTFFMQLPDSTYKRTIILPKLDAANKERRHAWSNQFFVFWESAKKFHRSMQLVVVHMDEKWFYVIVVRRNNKSIPFFGIEPVVHSVQHKSHIGKTMAIATTAFAPKNNDFNQGGDAYKVSLTRVGKMSKARRNTYKRVQKNDGSGTYHYPKIEENILRRKGQDYFKNMEITGSKTTGKNSKGESVAKFPLLDFFRDTEIPALEEIARRIETESGKKVCIRYQMDGAGPHTDKALLEFLETEFSDRDWILKFQPSNSPVTNVHDDCVFPMLSKLVSEDQGLFKGSQVFRNEDELFESVQKAWNRFELDKLARGYVRHAQVAAAIRECKGGDEFVREKNGLHCSVRTSCVTVYDENDQPAGVEVVSTYDPDETGGVLNPLRYSWPIMNDGDELERAFGGLNAHEINVLHDNVPLQSSWYAYIAAEMVKLMYQDMGVPLLETLSDTEEPADDNIIEDNIVSI